MNARISLGLLLGGGVSALLPCQDVVLHLVDGSEVAGRVRSAEGGDPPHLVLDVAGQSRAIPLSRLLSLHACTPQPLPAAVAYLVGGDQVRGEVVGGDDAGETVRIRSASLGPVPVLLDRLRALVFEPRAGAAPLAAFTVPRDGAGSEALFRPVEGGFEALLGGIHRFDERGVLFEQGDQGVPQLFAYDRLAAVAVDDGIAQQQAAAVSLVTRAGDVVGVQWDGADDQGLVCIDEHEVRRALPWGQVATLVWRGPDRVHLSDLEPVRTEQRGAPFDDGEQPLYGYRSDRAVTGGFLTVGGVAHAKGVGVHSHCVLTYRVPAGCSRFVARVGIDDSVLGLGVRGRALVSVKVDDTVVFGPVEVLAGQPAKDVGAVQVQPGDLLTLRAEFGEGWFIGDRVDWLQAVLLR